MNKAPSSSIGRTLLAAGTCLFAVSLQAQELYTFENLQRGPLHGQDSWVATERAVIETGIGANPSLVFDNDTNNLPQAAATRVNDAAFTFAALAFGLTNAVLGFDFRVADPGSSNSAADFLLAHRDHGFTDQGKIGLRYNGNLRQLMVMRADGAAYAGSVSNYLDVPGNWFRARLVVDFTKYGANGSGSLYVRNLSANEAIYSPVAYLQNISLLVANQGADPAGWDRMDARACNAQVDNLFVGFATNTAPVLGSLSNRTVAEGSLLTFIATATDLDLPSQALRFSLRPGSPAGASITPDGVFSWTPSETQGPGSYLIGIKVTDGGLPPMSATNVVTVTVQEVNTAPVLNALPNRTVTEGSLLSFQATATDADWPAQTLTCTLGPGFPDGAVITAGGEFRWTPSLGHWPATNLVQVIVTDNGSPPFSATQSFSVVVNHLPAPASPRLVRAPADTLRIRAEALLGSDPDGDALLLASVGSASAGGGTVTTNQGWVIYSPPAGPPNDDSFGYTVLDARGASAVGSVTVRVAPCLEPGLSLAWEGATNLQVRVRGTGIALRIYSVEFTEALPSPVWQVLGTATADTVGVFEYVDHVPAAAPGRFYRAACP